MRQKKYNGNPFQDTLLWKDGADLYQRFFIYVSHVHRPGYYYSTGLCHCIRHFAEPLREFSHSKKNEQDCCYYNSSITYVYCSTDNPVPFFSRVSMFSESFPQFKIKLTQATDQFVNWYAHEFNYSRSKINKWMSETQSDAISNYAYGKAFAQLGKMSVALLLVPVYLFMILYYKSLLLEFIRKLFRLEHHTAVVEVLTNSKIIIQSYLVGLVFEMLIMAVLNSAGLLLLGIDYAIMLGIIAAILNIIPYIGGIVGTLLPMLIAFVTKDSLVYPLMVLVIHIFIQFVDNNYIVPKIVASRVQINALISVIGVLIGGALWGVSGMFLSIPLIAILKVIFDHIEPLKPWGFLFGNIVPTNSKFSFIKLKKRA